MYDGTGAVKVSDFGYPAIVRNRPGKCFETYNYWIKVRLPGFLTETFNASIRFIHQDVVMGILCAHNCNPVNANDKSIWVAYTEPYITQPVRWSIVVDDVPKDMKYNTQVVRSFYPMSASRILVLTRNVFISSKGYTENLELKVSHGDLVASSSSRIQDIDGYMRLFGVSKEGHLYHYSTSSGKAIRFFNYYVFQLDISTLGAIWIVNSNYIPLLKFNPFWNKVALCGHSYNYYLACTITHDVVANTTDYDNFGVNELAEMLANGRVGLVLRAADYLIWDGVIPRDASGYQWKLSAKERSDILGFVNRVLSVHSLEVDLLTVLHILSIIFYSTGGNVEEDLPYFIDELDLLNTYVTASDWMNVRESASNTLFRVAQVMDYSGQEKGHRNPIDVPFGNVFERFIRVFSLARAQSSMYQHLLHKPFVSYMLRTEITYKYLKDSKLLEKMLILYAKTVANYNVLYYGVTTYGYHHAKLWTINDSYTGLLNALNRSNGYGGLKILQSYESKKSWFSRLQVQLPPTPFVLQYRELALTVVAMKNQLFDVYKSPFLLLLLKTKTGEYLNQLPDNLKYRIVLPLMKNGQILNESTEKTSFVDTIERAESNSDRQSEHFRYKAYKLTFPSLYESFQLTIFIDKPIHSRVKIDLERLPDYDDVMREPILNENKPFRTDKFTYIVKVLPEPGTSALPRSFYFAIIPTDELPIGEKLEISIFTTALLCRTRIIEYNEEGEYCQRIVNETVWDDLNIVCDCKKWGLTAVTEEEIRIVKFLMSDELLLKTFVPPDTFEQVSLESGLILFLPFLALAVANILDRLRRRKQSMIYTKYYFKRSQYPLIIGVYTGHRFGAGTVSSVAVQFVGSYGHSEIILLKRTRSKERKTLRRGHDDWFVVATKEFLGPIQSVYIWSNFRCTSSWYCSRILIFDVTSFRWFTAEVNHWFKFFESNEGSRLAMFEVTEYRFGRNTDIQGFIDHYIIELKNTHHLLSILEMHPRILYTHEQRITIFTVKVLAMLCWIFFVLELLFEQIFGVYYDPEENVPFKKSMKNKFSTCKGLQAIFLSPCQFYLIDAKTDIIDFKMRRVTLVARCIALFSLFTLFGAVLLILWGTPFIEKAFTSIFLVLITLVVDALIVNPIYALVRSVAMFYLLKVSNDDIALFLDEPKLAFPPPITHLEYVKMVTGKNYKPLLSVEIGRLKQVDRSKKFVVEVLFLILVAAAAVLCIMILLKLSDPSVFYGIRAMSELESRRLHREGGFQWITHGIDQVINLQNAVTYILYNFIMLEYQWYASGKNISEDNRRWARDYNSRPSDAISIIFIFMSNASSVLKSGSPKSRSGSLEVEAKFKEVDAG
ncbi:hypothetical protein GE061_015687 [Apolygus lucorum]|uniref:PLAT domain-containing protein n=1 Tax=Apolygus lucorum TaxID=248454 RepID=A0A8S9XLW2_APOLU|nr:hypothetical protein GE061_015687 [Apolygus lucorum]